MKKASVVLVLLFSATFLSSCQLIKPVPIPIPEGPFYTTCNIWYSSPGKINSTNFHKGNIVPAGTKVTINSVFSEKLPNPNSMGKINFTVDGTGESFTLVIVTKHCTISVKEYFGRHFSEQSVMDVSNGRFHTFSDMEKENVTNGRLEVGMRKNAVLMAFGYPPSHRTRSLEENTWHYWGDDNSSRSKITVYFRDDRLQSIDGVQPRSVQVYEPSKPADRDKSATRFDRPILVAVWDFRNLGGKKEYDWPSVGISELMTTYFDEISGIEPVSRASIEKILVREAPSRLSKTLDNASAKNMGEQLGAAYVIIGSYQTNGKDITVVARMVKTDTGHVLRAEDEIGELSKLDTVVGTLVLEMAGLIGKKASDTEKNEIKAQGAQMMKVIEGLSKGQLCRYTGDLDGARKLYKEALENNPTNSAALKHMKDIDTELKSIAIVKFEDNSDAEGFEYLSNAIPEDLTTFVVHKTALPLTERLNIEKAMQELKLGQDAIIDAETAPKVGELAGASQLIVGSFSVEGKDITINGRLIDTETAGIVGSESEHGLLKNKRKLEETLVDKMIGRLSKVRVVEMRPPEKPASKKEAASAVKKAKEALQNAENADAATIEPFKYTNVKTLIDQADRSLGNKNYDEARNKAYKGEAKARELAISARDVTSG